MQVDLKKPDGSLIKLQMCQKDDVSTITQAESPLINADKWSSNVSTAKE